MQMRNPGTSGCHRNTRQTLRDHYQNTSSLVYTKARIQILYNMDGGNFIQIFPISSQNSVNKNKLIIELFKQDGDTIKQIWVKFGSNCSLP